MSSPTSLIFIYVGTDEYAIRNAAEKHTAMFSDPTTAGMNTSRLDARTAGPNELSNALGSMPFLAAQRLVLLENVSKGFGGLDGHKKFITFLESVPPSTRLVISDAEELKPKNAGDHWLVKWAEKHPDTAECKLLLLPSAKEMPGWIIAEAKRQGGGIEPGAAVRLAEMTGDDTRQAAQELTKLFTYVNFSHTISLEDVEEVSIVTAQVSVFDLVDALGTQDGKKAQRLLRRMLEDKDALEIFGMVVRQFRLLIMTRELIEEHATLAEICKTLGMRDFVAGKMTAQAKNFDMHTLEIIYHRLLAMDEANKTGGMPLDASLEMLVVELAGKR